MDVKRTVDLQRKYYRSGATRSVHFRVKQLVRLKQAIEVYEPELMEALKLDLNKSHYETYLTEIGLVMSEIKHAIKQMQRRSKPIYKVTGIANFPGKSFTVREPYGVVLVLAPWNYPFQLAIAPLVGAISGGNCALIKCSNSSPHVTAVINEMIKKTFEPKYVTCTAPDTPYDDILEQSYDYMFFTGSPSIGKVVMKAASEHLTPVSLELGGKSPCFVDKYADLNLTARRLVWGKLLNSGQTCIAPDYVLVDETVKGELIGKILKEKEKRYGNLLENEDFPKIISKRHFNRLTGLIRREPHKIGGESNEERQKIELAIFDRAQFDSEIMKEEIFGPILPIIGYKYLDEAINEVVRRPKPLACYMFSQDPAYGKRIIKQVSFGGGCINDVVMHLANHRLPFGGVGNSGMGHYHGQYSYNTFTHEKAIVQTYRWPELPIRYAPFGKKSVKFLRNLF